MAVESGLEAAEFDLAVTPLRELNAALHARRRRTRRRATGAS